MAYSTSFLKAKTAHEPCRAHEDPSANLLLLQICLWRTESPFPWSKEPGLAQVKSEFCPRFWHVIQVIPDWASVFRTGAGHTQPHVIGQKDHHAIQHGGEMTMQAITGYQSLRHAAIKTPHELPLWEIQVAPQHFESSLYAISLF